MFFVEGTRIYGTLIAHIRITIAFYVKAYAQKKSNNGPPGDQPAIQTSQPARRPA